MPAIAYSLNSMKKVSLNDNCIGSYGARLITPCLASKPDIEALHLDDNLLNDYYAGLLAMAVKSL